MYCKFAGSCREVRSLIFKHVFCLLIHSIAVVAVVVAAVVAVAAANVAAGYCCC